MGLRVIGVKELRQELATVLDELGGVEEIVITQRGEGKAVLVGLERYNQLVDRLEFLEDSLDTLEAKREGAVPLDDVG